jgi:hypothetical protein
MIKAKLLGFGNPKDGGYTRKAADNTVRSNSGAASHHVYTIDTSTQGNKESRENGLLID